MQINVKASNFCTLQSAKHPVWLSQFLLGHVVCLTFGLRPSQVKKSQLYLLAIIVRDLFKNTEQATYVNKMRYLWIQAAEQAWYACARETCLIPFDTAVQTIVTDEQNIANQTREQKK